MRHKLETAIPLFALIIAMMRPLSVATAQNAAPVSLQKQLSAQYHLVLFLGRPVRQSMRVGLKGLRPALEVCNDCPAGTCKPLCARHRGDDPFLADSVS